MYYNLRIIIQFMKEMAFEPYWKVPIGLNVDVSWARGPMIVVMVLPPLPSD